ncbi:xanthine dehydrogenase family protein molybdopterin-binding subunit [Nonomuraea sp. NPDC049309]|uniref:xanthine dehydrogenase family protein molybdopterin-binding subunit n=1 Tax=Nonomuraea sp. NPDC049309 TaxID=3364350 RepID=UPI0037174365
MTDFAIPRVGGGKEKVTDSARFGADRTPEGCAYAMPVVATVGKGRITRLDTADAEAVPGVLLILSHLDDPGIEPAGHIMSDGYASQSPQPLLDDRVAYRGRPIALVVADTLIAAAHAASLVRAEYDEEPSAVEPDAEGAETVPQEEALPRPFLADVVAGDADGAYERSPLRIDEVYEAGPQYQVPMEHALQPHLAPLAAAARRVGRPVKLVLPRARTFHASSSRPKARHRVRLGADRSGRLLAAIHEVDQQASRHDLLPATYTEIASRLYDIRNFRGRRRHVRTGTRAPGHMRAPFELQAAFALESAIDELAVAAGRDPVELRLANDARTDPVTGKPFSPRRLAACLRRGAELFGWERRSPDPCSMCEADGTLVGWGVAVGAYPSKTVPVQVRLTAGADGRVLLDAGGHEVGQGITTALVAAVSGDLGIPPDAVAVAAGGTGGVPHHLTAGARGTDSTLLAVHAALRELRQRLGAGPEGPVDVAAAVKRTGADEVMAEAVTRAPGQPPEAIDRMRRGLVAPVGPEYPGFVTFSFIAHFAEVRVEPVTRRIRVSRMVSVADCGRVADYAIPVNADVGAIEVDVIGEPGYTLTPMGVKNLGEVAPVGVAPAIANAVFHATGRRVRRLPILIEDVL